MILIRLALAAVPLAFAIAVSPMASATPMRSESDAQAIERLARDSEAGLLKSVSTSEKALITREIEQGYAVVSEVDQPLSIPAAATTSCWSRNIEYTYYGGVSRMAMFIVGQTTRVCVASGKVTSVSVPNKYLNLVGRPGIYSKGVKSATNNVGWEGRGVAIGTAGFGIKIGEIEIGSSRSLCAQLRLNADKMHYQGSQSCGI